MSARIHLRHAFLDIPLGAAPRSLLVAAAVLLAAIYFSPLWTMTMFAQQYQDGLRLRIYAHKLDGGNGGRDVGEINVLNHYIGMRGLATEDFTEFKWLPFVVGALGLLFLRAAVHGRMAHLVDVTVLYAYFTGFALWSFAYRMWRYGHDLAPTAAVKVAPFMPPLFGRRQLANFEVYSYPGPASYALGLAMVLLVVAVFVTWRAERPPR
jgi:copper chaperone NosL